MLNKMLNKLIEKIQEYTYSDIMRKQRSITNLFPTFYNRVKSVGEKGGIRMEEMLPNLWKFKVHSGTQDDVEYEVYLNFKNTVDIINRFVPNQKLWKKDRSGVNIRLLAPEVLNKVDLETSCSCPASLYWGKDYIRTTKQAQYGKQEYRPPVVRNPKQYGALCFTKEAQVLMEDGTYKNICDVTVGEKVYTHTGNLSKVTEIFKRVSPISKLYEVKNLGFFNDSSFRVTGEHEFFVLKAPEECVCGCGKKRKLKSIREVCGLHKLFSIWFASKKCKKDSKILKNKPKWYKLENLAKKPKNFLFFFPKLKTKKKIKFNPELARLLGYYLAEGSLGGYEFKTKTSKEVFINTKGKKIAADSVCFTLSVQEKDTLMLDILNIIHKYFGVKGKVDFCPPEGNKGEGYISVDIRDQKLVKLCYKYCGVINKRKLHKEIFQWDDLAKWNFLLGGFLGDGYINISEESKGAYFSTVQRNLAEQLSTLLGFLNVYHTIQVSKYGHNGKIYGDAYNIYFRFDSLPLWVKKECLRLGKKNSNKNYKLKINKFNPVVSSGVYKKPKQITQLKGEDFVEVYNLEVASKDHSYIVNGVAVHNCKHGELVFELLPMYTSTFASFLKKFHLEDINQAFNRVVRELEGFKKAGEELGKLIQPEPEDKTKFTQAGEELGKKAEEELKSEEPKEELPPVRDTLADVRKKKQADRIRKLKQQEENPEEEE